MPLLAMRAGGVEVAREPLAGSSARSTAVIPVGGPGSAWPRAAPSDYLLDQTLWKVIAGTPEHHAGVLLELLVSKLGDGEGADSTGSGRKDQGRQDELYRSASILCTFRVRIARAFRPDYGAVGARGMLSASDSGRPSSSQSSLPPRYQ